MGPGDYNLAGKVSLLWFWVEFCCSLQEFNKQPGLLSRSSGAGMGWDGMEGCVRRDAAGWRGEGLNLRHLGLSPMSPLLTATHLACP